MKIPIDNTQIYIAVKVKESEGRWEDKIEEIQGYFLDLVDAIEYVQNESKKDYIRLTKWKIEIIPTTEIEQVVKEIV